MQYLLRAWYPNKNKDKNNMSKISKLEDLKQYIESASLSLQEAKELVMELVGQKEGQAEENKAAKVGSVKDGSEGKIIEGVFDGQEMIGPDGKKYSIPANYASKSKLVEGDILKLTIKQDGSFVYKQIGPVARARIKGLIMKDKDTGEYRVLAEGKSYKVLLASLTYFKGEDGDDVVILVPEDKSSTWGAVENVIKKIELTGDINQKSLESGMIPNVLPNNDNLSVPKALTDIAEFDLFPEENLKTEKVAEKKAEFFQDSEPVLKSNDSEHSTVSDSGRQALPNITEPPINVIRDLSVAEHKKDNLDDLSLNSGSSDKMADL